MKCPTAWTHSIVVRKKIIIARLASDLLLHVQFKRFDRLRIQSTPMLRFFSGEPLRYHWTLHRRRVHCVGCFTWRAGSLHHRHCLARKWRQCLLQSWILASRIEHVDRLIVIELRKCAFRFFDRKLIIVEISTKNTEKRNPINLIKEIWKCGILGELRHQIVSKNILIRDKGDLTQLVIHLRGTLTRVQKWFVR